MTSNKATLHKTDPVTHWAEEVEAGRIIAGPHVRDTARRHLTDLETGKDRGLVWDSEEAKRRIDLFPKYFRLNGGDFEGRRFHLHPSQAFRAGSLYGWKMENGERRFRRYYDEEGKGNGKSPFLAGLGMQGLVFDRRARAEIYAAASKKDQAMVLFRDAVAMRNLSPELSTRVGSRGREPVYQLFYEAAGGDKRYFRPISSDDGQSGPRPYMALLDELHEIKNRNIFDMLERGLAKSPVNTLLAMATNSGHDRNSFCYEQHLHAVKVAAGDEEDDRLFSFVCALDDDDDWLEDEECWAKTNPLLGVTIQTDDLAEAVHQAKIVTGKRNEIARLHFCVWTEGHTVWIPRDQVVACEDPNLTPAQFEGSEAFIGLDLGAKHDMTARVTVWEDGIAPNGKPKFALWAHGYTPRKTLLERERRDQAPYSQWVDHGDLTATDGEIVDLDYVAKDVVDDAERFRLAALAYDEWMFQRFTDKLNEYGVELPIVRHPQGTNKDRESGLFMPDSINAFEELIIEGRLRMGVNLALRNAIMGAQFYTAASGLRRFDKRKATVRNDLAVAAVMAVGAATGNLEAKRTGTYLETEDLLVVG